MDYVSQVLLSHSISAGTYLLHVIAFIYYFLLLNRVSLLVPCLIWAVLKITVCNTQ